MQKLLRLEAMSEDQLKALLASLKDDANLREKLKGLEDLDAVVAVAQEAGFSINKEALLRYQANQSTALGDEDLEKMAGGQFIEPGDQGGFCFMEASYELTVIACTQWDQDPNFWHQPGESVSQESFDPGLSISLDGGSEDWHK